MPTSMRLDVTSTLLSGTTATGAGSIFAAPTKANTYTWQYVATTAGTSVTAVIQGSLDGSQFDTIDTNTTTTGAIRTFNSNATQFKANITALNGASGISIYMVGKAL